MRSIEPGLAAPSGRHRRRRSRGAPRAHRVAVRWPASWPRPRWHAARHRCQEPVARRGLLRLHGRCGRGRRSSTSSSTTRPTPRSTAWRSRPGACSARRRACSGRCRPWPRSPPSRCWPPSAPSWPGARSASSPRSSWPATAASSPTASRSGATPSRCCSPRWPASAFAVDVRRPSNRALVGWVLASLALTYSNLAAATLIVSQLLTLFVLPAERRLWKRRLVAGGAARRAHAARRAADHDPQRGRALRVGHRHVLGRGRWS